jgi:3',5'-cyclic AMP phosphodiesterase CpdA
MFKRIAMVVAAVGVMIATAAWRGEAPSAAPFYFIQFSDPQLGMYRADSDFVHDAANFEFAIASANRLRPAFVVVTGDLVNKPGDSAQVAAYHRIAARLDRRIQLYNLPGNHDVGNIPTPASIARYRRQFGPDHYVFRSGSLVGVVLNSSLLQQPDSAPGEDAAQEKWLGDTLAVLSRDHSAQIVIFQHHPWFLSQPDEAGQYFNIPVEKRARYLALFKRYGVRYLFSGHYHQNSIGHDGPIEMITTGPVGKPFGDVPRSGFRIAMVTDSGIVHKFFDFSDIPDRMPVLR